MRLLCVWVVVVALCALASARTDLSVVPMGGSESAVCGGVVHVVGLSSPAAATHRTTLLLEGGSSGYERHETVPCTRDADDDGTQRVRCTLTAGGSPLAGAPGSSGGRIPPGNYRVSVVHHRHQDDGGTPRSEVMSRPLRVRCWSLMTCLRDSGELVRAENSANVELLREPVPTFVAEAGDEPFSVLLRDEERAARRITSGGPDGDEGADARLYGEADDDRLGTNVEVMVLPLDDGSVADTDGYSPLQPLSCQRQQSAPASYYGSDSLAFACAVPRPARALVVIGTARAGSLSTTTASKAALSHQPLLMLDVAGPVVAMASLAQDTETGGFAASSLLPHVPAFFTARYRLSVDVRLPSTVSGDGASSAAPLLVAVTGASSSGAATKRGARECEGLMVATVALKARSPVNAAAGASAVVTYTGFVDIDTASLFRGASPDGLMPLQSLCARRSSAHNSPYLKVGSVNLPGVGSAEVQNIAPTFEGDTADLVMVGEALERVYSRIAITDLDGSAVEPDQWNQTHAVFRNRRIVGGAELTSFAADVKAFSFMNGTVGALTLRGSLRTHSLWPVLRPAAAAFASLFRCDVSVDSEQLNECREPFAGQTLATQPTSPVVARFVASPNTLQPILPVVSRARLAPHPAITLIDVPDERLRTVGREPAVAGTGDVLSVSGRLQTAVNRTDTEQTLIVRLLEPVVAAASSGSLRVLLAAPSLSSPNTTILFDVTPSAESSAAAASDLSAADRRNPDCQAGICWVGPTPEPVSVAFGSPDGAKTVVPFGDRLTDRAASSGDRFFVEITGFRLASHITGNERYSMTAGPCSEEYADKLRCTTVAASWLPRTKSLVAELSCTVSQVSQAVDVCVSYTDPSRAWTVLQLPVVPSKQGATGVSETSLIIVNSRGQRGVIDASATLLATTGYSLCVAQGGRALVSGSPLASDDGSGRWVRVLDRASCRAPSQATQQSSAAAEVVLGAVFHLARGGTLSVDVSRAASEVTRETVAQIFVEGPVSRSAETDDVSFAFRPTSLGASPKQLLVDESWRVFVQCDSSTVLGSIGLASTALSHPATCDTSHCVGSINLGTFTALRSFGRRLVDSACRGKLSARIGTVGSDESLWFDAGELHIRRREFLPNPLTLYVDAKRGTECRGEKCAWLAPHFGTILLGSSVTISLHTNKTTQDGPGAQTVEARLVVHRGHPGECDLESHVCGDSSSGDGWYTAQVASLLLRPLVPQAGITRESAQSVRIVAPAATQLGLPTEDASSVVVFCTGSRKDGGTGRMRLVGVAQAAGFVGPAELLPRAANPSAVVLQQHVIRDVAHQCESAHVTDSSKLSGAAGDADVCSYALAIVPCRPGSMSEPTLLVPMFNASVSPWRPIFGAFGMMLADGSQLVSLPQLHGPSPDEAGRWSHHALAIRIGSAAGSSWKWKHGLVTNCDTPWQPNPSSISDIRASQHQNGELSQAAKVGDVPMLASVVMSHEHSDDWPSVRLAFSEPIVAARGVEVRYFSARDSRGAVPALSHVLALVSGTELPARFGAVLQLSSDESSAGAAQSHTIDSVAVQLPGPGMLLVTSGAAGGRPPDSISAAFVGGLTFVLHDPLFRAFHVGVAMPPSHPVAPAATLLVQQSVLCDAPPLDRQPTFFVSRAHSSEITLVNRTSSPWARESVLQVRFHSEPFTDQEVSLCITWRPSSAVGAPKRHGRPTAAPSRMAPLTANVVIGDAPQFFLTQNIDIKSSTMERLGTRGYFTFTTNAFDFSGTGTIEAHARRASRLFPSDGDGDGLSPTESMTGPRGRSRLLAGDGSQGSAPITASVLTVTHSASACPPLGFGLRKTLPVLKAKSRHAISRGAAGAGVTWVFVGSTPGRYCLYLSRLGVSVNAGFATVPGPLHALPPAAVASDLDPVTGAVMTTSCSSESVTLRAAVVPPPHGASALTRNWASDFVLVKVQGTSDATADGSASSEEARRRLRTIAAQCNFEDVAARSSARVLGVDAESTTDLALSPAASRPAAHLSSGTTVRIRLSVDTPGLYGVCLRPYRSRELSSVLSDTAASNRTSPVLEPRGKFFGLVEARLPPDFVDTLASARGFIEPLRRTTADAARIEWEAMRLGIWLERGIPEHLKRQAAKQKSAGGSFGVCGIQRVGLSALRRGTIAWSRRWNVSFQPDEDSGAYVLVANADAPIDVVRHLCDPAVSGGDEGAASTLRMSFIDPAGDSVATDLLVVCREPRTAEPVSLGTESVPATAALAPTTTEARDAGDDVMPTSPWLFVGVGIALVVLALVGYRLFSSRGPSVPRRTPAAVAEVAHRLPKHARADSAAVGQASQKSSVNKKRTTQKKPASEVKKSGQASRQSGQAAPARGAAPPMSAALMSSTSDVEPRASHAGVPPDSKEDHVTRRGVTSRKSRTLKATPSTKPPDNAGGLQQSERSDGTPTAPTSTSTKAQSRRPAVTPARSELSSSTDDCEVASDRPPGSASSSLGNAASALQQHQQGPHAMCASPDVDEDDDGADTGVEPRELTSDTDVSPGVLRTTLRGARGTDDEATTTAPETVFIAPRRASALASNAGLDSRGEGTEAAFVHHAAAATEPAELRSATVPLVDIARGIRSFPLPPAGPTRRTAAAAIGPSFADALFDLLHSNLHKDLPVRRTSGRNAAELRVSRVNLQDQTVAASVSELCSMLQRLRVGVLLTPGRAATTTRVAWYATVPSDRNAAELTTDHEQPADDLLLRLRIEKVRRAGRHSMAPGDPSSLGWSAAEDAERSRRCPACEVFVAVLCCCGSAMPDSLWALKPPMGKMWREVLWPLPSWLENVVALGVFSDDQWGRRGQPSLLQLARRPVSQLMSDSAVGSVIASAIGDDDTPTRAAATSRCLSSGAVQGSTSGLIEEDEEAALEALSADLMALGDASRRRFATLHGLAS